MLAYLRYNALLQTAMPSRGMGECFPYGSESDVSMTSRKESYSEEVWPPSTVALVVEESRDWRSLRGRRTPHPLAAGPFPFLRREVESTISCARRDTSFIEEFQPSG